MNPNRAIGAEVCRALEAEIRSWGFEVKDHEDFPRDAPGDLAVGNGNGRRLFVECKGYRAIVRPGRAPSGTRHRTYPGRPLLTSSRHAWLAREGGIYVFARYRLEDGRAIVDDLRFLAAALLEIPRDRRLWALPWARLGELDSFDAGAVRRSLEEATP